MRIEEQREGSTPSPVQRDKVKISINQNIWQMTELRKLHIEFQCLKAELIGTNTFVEVEETYLQKRYSQLLGFFFPCYRTSGWINPALPSNSLQICDSQEVQEAYELYYL